MTREVWLGDEKLQAGGMLLEVSRRVREREGKIERGREAMRETARERESVCVSE